MVKSSIASGLVPIFLLLVAAALYFAGYDNIGGFPLVQAGDFVFAFLAAGQFTVGVFAAGTFAVGIFSAGIFAIGVFSIGIFCIGIFSFCIYALGFYVAYRFVEHVRRAD